MLFPPYPIHIGRKKVNVTALFIHLLYFTELLSFTCSLRDSAEGLLSTYWARGYSDGLTASWGIQTRKQTVYNGSDGVLTRSSGLSRLTRDPQSHLRRSSEAFWRKWWLSWDLRLRRRATVCQAEGGACRTEWRGQRGDFKEQILYAWKEGWGELRVKPRWDLEWLCKHCEEMWLTYINLGVWFWAKVIREQRC